MKIQHCYMLHELWQPPPIPFTGLTFAAGALELLSVQIHPYQLSSYQLLGRIGTSGYLLLVIFPSYHFLQIPIFGSFVQSPLWWPPAQCLTYSCLCARGLVLDDRTSYPGMTKLMTFSTTGHNSCTKSSQMFLFGPGFSPGAYYHQSTQK